MKRNSQEKPKKVLQTEASKLKEMQKAYGILPKEVSKRKTSMSNFKPKSESETSLKKDKPVAQKSRNSLGSQSNLSSNSNSNRKSYPYDSTTRTKTTTSKIVAASKANYAEKYGDQHKSKVLQPQSPSAASPAKRKVSVGGGVSSTNSPYKQKTLNQKSSRASIASTSTTSRLTSQKQPSLYSTEGPEEEPEENDDYGEEDFEEDYESDFEDGEDSEDEPEPEPEEPERNGFSLQVEPEIEDESISIRTDEYEKSSSIREFENLERMVEIEALQQNKSMIEANLASGEPGGGNVPLKYNVSEKKEEEEEESDEDDEEQDDKVVPPPIPIPKQNAFPQMTGFSLNSSNNNFRETENQSRSEYNFGGQRTPGKIVGSVRQGPSYEHHSEKMRRANRGKIIQGMIKLDRVSVDIFHLSPYQYERFMAVFSGTNRFQASTQTDRDKSEESAQTDPIEQTAKWTQKPPTWSTTSSSCDIRIVRQEALGVGTDEISDDLLSPDQKIHKQFDFLKNWEQLSKFIIRSSRKVLYVLEAEERIKLPSNSGSKGALETIKMNRGLSVLSKLGMHTLAGDGEYVACTNGQREPGAKEKTTNGNKKHTSKNLVTIWSLKEPSMPLYFLRVWGHVSSLKLHMVGRMIVSGNKDGSLNIWNLDEPICYHSNYQEQIIRTPSVNTSCMMPTHILPVVGVEMFSETKNTFSIVSVDKEGVLITWSCVRSQDSLGETTLSQFSSAWSTIHISVRYQVQLSEVIREPLEITCFFVMMGRADEAFESFCFGTFNGYGVKGKIEVQKDAKGGANAVLERYQERTDSNPKITCLDVSTVLNILVMGCEDGRCRLFELSRKKMVLSVGTGSNNNGEQQAAVKVKWSNRRASVLYVAMKDSLLIWDLLTSDMNPWKTIHLKDIQDFVLYTPIHKEYLVIISGNDLIISTPSNEVRPLSSRDFSRIQSYFSLLC